MSLHIDHSEKRDGMLVVWIAEGDEPHDEQFGIAFEGTHANITRDGIVSSILLALEMFGDAIDSLEQGGVA